MVLGLQVAVLQCCSVAVLEVAVLRVADMVVEGSRDDVCGR